MLNANSSWQLDWQHNKFLDDHVNDHLSALLEVGSIQHRDICWNTCDIFERKKKSVTIECAPLLCHALHLKATVALQNIFIYKYICKFEIFEI